MTKTIKREDVVNALEAADVFEAEDAIRENYSGRGYVDPGFGIIISADSHAFAFFAALGHVGGENDQYDDGDDADLLTSEKAYELACKGRTDGMGHERIVYFPGWTLS